MNRFKEVLQVLGFLAWRGFGIFLFILGGSAGVGAALTGNWLNGVLISWGTLMIGVVSAIGYAIATTGKATKSDIAKATNDAVQKAKDEQEKNSSVVDKKIG
jgi:hypothetical protein